jgi:hypothetical protein
MSRILIVLSAASTWSGFARRSFGSQRVAARHSASRGGRWDLVSLRE